MSERTPPRGAEFPPTHRVAVSAYIFRAGKLLLLKRTNPPLVFAPVGGHLHPDEEPLAGLQREVAEETGLDIEILALADAWFGSVDGMRPPILGLDYIAECPRGDVSLNEEHEDFQWAAREEIASGAICTLDDRQCGYEPEAILAAFDLYYQMRGIQS